MFGGQPAVLAIWCFDAQPMRSDDEDEDAGLGRKLANGGGGTKGRGFQVGAGRFYLALEFVVERSDLLLQIFLLGVG